MKENGKPRLGLGRGLSALMADVNEQGTDVGAVARIGAMRPIEDLVPNPDQPRRSFNQDALAELAESIRVKGIVQPLIVRPRGAPGKFEIVAGERRWRAAQLAGLHEVPVLIRDYGDEEVLEIAIIENIQRSDLNSIEEALAYHQLMNRFGHTQEKLAASLSRSRSHIANTLRLLSLPESVQDLLRSDKLTAGHARALVTAKNAASLALDIVKRGLSVRETERLVKLSLDSKDRKGDSKRGVASHKDADTKAIESDLSANLGMSVTITHDGVDDSGTLSIKYRSLADLDMLCDLISKAPRPGIGGR